MSRLRNYIKNNEFAYKLLFPVVNAWRYLTKYYIPEFIFLIQMFLRKIYVLPCDPILKELEGAESGKRIFIVAGGPSMRVEDLETIESHGDICISLNSIYRYYVQTSWRPDYYLMTDYLGVGIIREHNPENRFEEFAKKAVLLSEPCRKKLYYEYDRSKIGFIPFSYQDHWLNHFSKRRKYRKDMKTGAYDLFTVSCSAINLADYMGASEVYLYSFDGYANVKAAHPWEDEQTSFSEEEIKGQERTNRKMERGYEYIRDYVVRDGFRIYNATRGGFLEVFPRVEFDSLFGN